MRVVVFGAGAVGGALGAYLARAGHDVQLVGRPDVVAAIGAGGLRVHGRLEGTFRVAAVASLAPGTPADLVLVTVKAWDVPAAVGAIVRAVPAGPPIFLLQNGLGILEAARAAFAEAGGHDPDRTLVRAINSIPATTVGPGEVRIPGDGEIVLPPAEGPAAAAIARGEALLRGAGLSVRRAADFPREVWRKVLVNAAINPVTALHGVPNGRLLEEPYRAEARALLFEAADVARAVGVPISEKEAEAEFERVARATAENRSSMLQDLDRHRPTEVDAILGAIEELGRARHRPVPVTERTIAALRTRAAERWEPGPEPS